RIGLAFRVFFRILFDAALAERVRPLLVEAAAVPTTPAAPKLAEKTKKKPARSDALNLLAMLQREARFVDFIQESIAGYSDEQIGAAVRDVHRDCAAVLQRAFALSPIRTESEGSTVELPAEFDAARYRLAGHVPERPPFRGMLAHHGWQATQCVLPDWSGADDATMVVAPAVVELT
ncbi:MAG TPA: DUF2760 domain-containing protein, partial [Pirellulales bacterium]|nr:DUF2760 domain-containing protein [Pirellulales bacterium]